MERILIELNNMIKKIKSEAIAVQIQKKLYNSIAINEKFDLTNLKVIAGVDLAYWTDEDTEYAVCCIVVIDYITHEILEKVHAIGQINFPYIPGCLAFRELPLVVEAFKKLNNDPELLVFDGNGYLHPRHMGIATHAGIHLNKATIGVAKSYYKVSNTDFIMPDNVKGAYTNIVINEETYGRALRTHVNTKPVFVSVGNYIDIESATNIIINLISSNSRIPIPTRLADIETRKVKKEYLDLI